MTTMDTLPSTLTAVCSILMILVLICVALVSHRFGEDKPHQDDDVPDESNIPQQRRWPEE